MLSCSLDLKHTWEPSHNNSPTDGTRSLAPCVCSWAPPAPVGLSNGGIVNYGRQQRREGPQQQGGEELADDGALGGKKTNKSGNFLFFKVIAATFGVRERKSHVEIVDRHRHVEPVHGADDDGRSGEEGQQEEEEEVEHQVAHEPGEASH